MAASLLTGRGGGVMTSREASSILARGVARRLTLSIAMLSLLAAVMVFVQLRQQAVTDALIRLSAHSQAIADSQEHRFRAIAAIESEAVSLQLAQLPTAAANVARFDTLAPVAPDGSRRGVPQLYTGRSLADGTPAAGTAIFIARGPARDRDRALLLAALTTIERLAAGLPADIDNLYFFTPSDALVIHAPKRPDRLQVYRRTAPADYSLQNAEPAQLMDPRRNPRRVFRCTRLQPIASDLSRRTWTTGCMTPLDRGGRHLGSWGVSLLVDRLFTGQSLYALPGAQVALVSTEGQLIYHPAITGQADRRLDDRLDLNRAKDAELAALGRVVRATGTGRLAQGYDAGGDLYYAVARVPSAGWLAVSWYPGGKVDAEAWTTARTVLLVGFAGCLAIALIIMTVLRERVGRPLVALRVRAEALVATDNSEPDPGMDEVAALNRAFDVMATAVRAERSRLNRSFELLARNVTSVAIIVLDADAHVAEWNAGAERLTGYAGADIIGQSATLLRGDSTEAMTALAAARAGASQRLEGWRFRRDGSAFWAVELLEPLPAEPGAPPPGFALLLRDESEAHADELRLRETLRLLTLAEETGESGHWRIDLATDSTQWSERAAALLGGADPNFAASFSAADRPAINAALAAAASAGTAFILDVQSDTDSPDPEALRHFEIRGQAETDGQGRIVALFGIVRDTTAAMQAREALVTARDQARAAAEAHADLLAMVSHEIRTPMTGILGLAELGDAGPETIATIRSSARMLMTILDDVLDHSTLEAGRLTLEDSAVDLSELASSTASLFQQTARRAGLTLDCRVEADGLVRGDRTRLQQILSNLISNALKFTERGGISVTISRTGADVVMAVSDTGIGIDPAIAERLFDPFVQAERSTRRRFGGTGLGLSIVRRLAEAMGGRVSVASQPGEGSTFTVTVPLPAIAPAAAPTRGDKPLRGPGGGPPRVLVVDDTTVTRELVRAFGASLGCEVVGAADGLAALAELLGGRFDLVLLDWQLPGLSGGDVVRLLRLLPPPAGRTPVLAFTASVGLNHPDVVELTDGTLGKPFTLAMLREALAQGLAVARPPPRAAADPLAGVPADLAGRLAASFRAEAGQLAERIAAALAADDAAAARTAIHALKGIAASLGAARLTGKARFALALLEQVSPAAVPWLAAGLSAALADAGITGTSLAALAEPPPLAASARHDRN